MPRQPRYSTVGQPQHVIQRGNNRTTTFRARDDYTVFHEYLVDAAERFECVVHAYVLMTNHVHLLMTPQVPGAVGQALQSVGRRYVHRFNKRYGRTGTLWEGRYRATLIDTDAYLFTCYRYIELNPVRAGLVAQPGEYRWSSFGANALGRRDSLVQPHALYTALAPTRTARRAAYLSLFRVGLDEVELEAIRDATAKAWALGGDGFRRIVSQRDRRAGPLPTGRRSPAACSEGMRV